MSNLTAPLTFTVPLTRQARQIAEKFRRKQSNPAKAEQVYRNTLAVLAVNFYCECMGIETELEKSDSWNPLRQSLADIADLEMKNLGKLECRPVLASSEAVEIPAEVWHNRIGYVAVQLSESMREAKLAGFVETIEAEELPLSEWRSLADFLERVRSLKQSQSVKEPIKLSQWLHDIFEAGWETVESLLAPPQVEVAFGFRSLQQNKFRKAGVERGKVIGLERAGEQVALFVGLQPGETPEMDIRVEVHPAGGQTYLPQDLHLMVLDETGEVVMQAQAKSTKNIQLEFSGEPGERFSVKVALGDVSITEAFVI